MLNIVLFEPEIPHNTGAVGRLCLATGASLHLVKPLGFSLEDKHLKRCGLDYWYDVDVHVWDSWEHLLSAQPASASGRPAEFYYVEVQGTRAPWEADFSDQEASVFLVFGPETRGIPPAILETGKPDHQIKIPMLGTRSLNLATSVAITLYEAVRQRGGLPAAQSA